MVLRRYVWQQFRDDEPDAPEREIAALDYAARHGLPVPSIIAADPAGSDIGDGIPALLMGRLPGRAQPAPNAAELAALAARIHAVDGTGFEYRYSPWCRETSTRPPTGCSNPRRWERALQIWRCDEPAGESRFIHRDFHPGNVLWCRARLSGLVDLVNACAGPPGVDVATCRWNLADWADLATGDAFVAAYEGLTGRRHHPYWDIAGILQDDWDLIQSPSRVAQAERFLVHAMRRWAEYC